MPVKHLSVLHMYVAISMAESQDIIFSSPPPPKRKIPHATLTHPLKIDILFNKDILHIYTIYK